MKQFAKYCMALSVFCIAHTSPVWAQTFSFPFKGEDLDDVYSERIYRGKAQHSSSGVQQFGLDLGVSRYNPDTKLWRDFGGDGTKNFNFYAYDKPVYAIEDGMVIACWRNAPENPAPGQTHEEITKYAGNQSRIYGGGNGYWIEHADGSRVEYAHFRPGTVPISLCPHNDQLTPLTSSPSVAAMWRHIYVPPGQRASVKKGQFLGRVGNAGTSSAPHLHIHREQGGSYNATQKINPMAASLNFRSGLAGDLSQPPNQEWTSFAGNPVPAGPLIVWPSRSPAPEFVQAGLPDDEFGMWYQHLTDSGYGPVWVDAYNVGDRFHFNQIWQPTARQWFAYVLVDEAHYQNIFDELPSGFSPINIETTTDGSRILYNVVFQKKNERTEATHGLSTTQLRRFDGARKGTGMVPVNISGVSVSGQRQFAVLYRRGDIGDYTIESAIPISAYHNTLNIQAAFGRVPLYVNSYAHRGKTYVSAIFGEFETAARWDQHDMDLPNFRNEHLKARRRDMLTQAVTGADGAADHRYTAIWWRLPPRPKFRRKSSRSD